MKKPKTIIIPETSEDRKFIEFRINTDGSISLKAVNYIWRKLGFSSTDGSYGNCCKPNEIQKAIDKLHAHKRTEINKEIRKLKKELKEIDKSNKWLFVTETKNPN